MAYERRRTKKIILENTRLIYKPNFSGDPSLNYSPNDTSRNFNIVLDEKSQNARYGTCEDDMKPLKIEDLVNDGWNVKFTNDEDATPFLPVTASYKKRGPNIIKAIGTSSKIKVDESNISDLDSDYIENIDYITINSYEWEPGRIKAYLRDMFVTVEDDPFMRRFGSDFTNSELIDDADDDDVPF